jgi:hypothetical protein
LPIRHVHRKFNLLSLRLDKQETVEKPALLLDNCERMARKKAEKPTKSPKDLWIAPRYSLKGPAGERAWENRPGGAPNSSRFLELADIALGIKKPSMPKKKTAFSGAHDTSKTEPYSGLKYQPDEPSKK